jgi:hypothetical protein
MKIDGIPDLITPGRAPKERRWIKIFHDFIAQLRIQSKEVAAVDQRGSPLELWGSQRIFVEQIAEGMDRGVRTFFCLKSRQLGCSTVSLAIDLFWLATHAGMIGCLVVDNETNRDAFRATLKMYHSSLPKEFIGKSFQLVKNNSTFMSFSNGSRLDFLVAGTRKKTWGESRGYTLAHLCMAKGTPVVVQHGRIKNVEDVKVGDKVITHLGNEATVIDVFGQSGAGKRIIKIQPWLGHAVKYTEWHKIPTQRGLIQAKDVRKDDLLVMPVRQITGGTHTVTLPESKGIGGIRYLDPNTRKFVKKDAVGAVSVEREQYINVHGAGSGVQMPLTEEVGYAIGYYLAEGYLIHNSLGGPCGIVFARHRAEAPYADRACAALRPFTTGHRKTTDRENSLTTSENIYGTPLAEWIGENFGFLDEKRIPDEVFGWGTDFCRGLLSGILCGDGSKNVIMTNGKYPANQVVMPTTRSSLAMQTRDLAASLGIGWATINFKEGGNHYGRNCKPCWRITWNGSAAAKLRRMMGRQDIGPRHQDHTNKYILEDGRVLIKIRSIEECPEEEEIWDISVDHEDHTFRTPYMSTSNTEVAKYGTQEGLASFREALAETNPDRLFIYESTAFGRNHWYTMYLEGERDTLTKKSFFIGWWSKELNSISRKDPRFNIYGRLPPNQEENEKILLVQQLHGIKISPEQLAWKRWKDSDSSTTQADQDQNQPWLAQDAFVQSGYSFFPYRYVEKLLNVIYDPENNILFSGYRFVMGEKFEFTVMDPVDDALDAELKIWDEPNPDATYVIGCDPAFGRNDWKDRHCHSQDTEILTRNGWKKYNEISIGDLAVCFDYINEEYIYGDIQDIIVKDYEGDMFRFSSDGLDCCVTPDHRMVTRYWTKLRSGKNPAWRIKTAEEVSRSAKGSILSIPIGGSPFGPGIDGLSLEMCRALGWIMTDGYCSRWDRSKDFERKRGSTGKRIRSYIVVAQSKNTTKNNTIIWREMVRVFSELCNSPTIREHNARGNTNEKIVIRISVDDAEKFLEWLDESDIHKIPRRLLMQCSEEQCRALFLGLMEGDGGWDKNIGRWVKFCPGHATDLADGFQELALKLGYSATRVVQKGYVDKRGWVAKPQWLVRLSDRPQHCIRRQDNYREPYSGKVWCVTVPTGAFVARRNGKAFVTGNCCTVWRCYADKMVQVAEYAADNVYTYQAAWVLAYLCGIYKNCLVNIELTGGPGHAVFKELNDMRDSLRADMNAKIVRERAWDDFLANATYYLWHRPDSLGAGYAYHTDMSGKIKFAVWNKFRDSLMTGALVPRSAAMLEEAIRVVQEGSQIEAKQPDKDDRVAAGVLAHMAWQDWIRPGMIQRGATYEEVTKSEEGRSTPVGNTVKVIVQNFWKTVAQRAEEEANPQSPLQRFMEERGFYE